MGRPSTIPVLTLDPGLRVFGTRKMKGSDSTEVHRFIVFRVFLKTPQKKDDIRFPTVSYRVSGINWVTDKITPTFDYMKNVKIHQPLFSSFLVIKYCVLLDTLNLKSQVFISK